MREDCHQGGLPFRDYAEVPWFRRSSTNSALLLIQLVTWSFFPVSIFVCVVLLTGNIYYKTKAADGNLNVWGFANKLAAVLVLVVSVALWFLNPLRAVR